MTFDEILSQVQDLLQREQRVSYRGLKRRFALDDEYIEDLKEELIGAKRIAVDEDGRFLVCPSRDNLVSRVNPGSRPKVPGPKSEVGKEAKECFLKAIKISRRQQAKSLELRMTTTLVWLQQHKQCSPHHVPRNARHAPGATKHTACYPRSTTGSLKGLIPRICSRRRHF